MREDAELLSRLVTDKAADVPCIGEDINACHAFGKNRRLSAYTAFADPDRLCLVRHLA